MSSQERQISNEREADTTSPVLLTPQQQTAVILRDVSIGLSAGAGSGKTHVLTQRFLSHLDPTGPDAADLKQLDTLIAITFTEAAAREMRSRVRTACFERIVHARPKHQSHWYQVLRSLNSARISTIHSFCGSFLRRHAVEAGIDPRFAVLEENQAEVLRSQRVDDLLRSRLIDGDETLLDLAHRWGIDQLRSRILDLMQHVHADGFIRWADASPDDLLDTWDAHHQSDTFHIVLKDSVIESTSAKDVLKILSIADVENEVFTERRDTLLDQIGHLADSDDIGRSLLAIRTAAKVQGIGGKSAWSDPELYVEYGAACKQLRALIDRLPIDPWDRDAARPTAETAIGLHHLALEAADRYAAEKAALSRLDFDDLIARAVGLLSDPDHPSVRQHLAKGAHAILVDEFQDTDPQQAALVRTICGDAWQDGRLFFVGDTKQSIYRFRGAQPEVFRTLRTELPDRGKLSLTQCFRSQPAVLDFVNSLFVGIWGSDYEALESTRLQSTPEPAVEFVWTVAPAEGAKRKGDAARARKAEARMIAARLKDLIESGVPLIPESADDDDAPPSLQPLRLGHIAILFRALSDIAYYEAALQEAELDYYLVGGHAFYAQQEVYDFVNLLRAVASPADDVSLAGALRSPFFSLADESLFWLVNQGGSLNLGLMADDRPSALPEREREKIDRAAKTLALLRDRKDHVPIAELIDAALEQTGYDATLLADFMGERKLANLQKLRRLARAADRDGILDLHGFITQLGEFVVRMPKEAPASTSSETADVIRLMTVHQAKGLEFPLVVVADIDRPAFGGSDGVTFSPSLGPLIRPEFRPGEPKSITGYEMMRVEESREDRDEAARLFYVACTRAADFLILSANIKDLETPQGEWCRLLASRYDLQSGSPRLALPTGYRAPKIRVTQRTSDSISDSPRPGGTARLADVLKRTEALATNALPIPREVAPVPADTTSRQRFSFSQLSGMLVAVHGENDDRDGTTPMSLESVSEPRILRELEETGVDSRALGSLVHAALEIVRPDDTIPVSTLVSRLAPRFFDFDETAETQSAAAMASEMVQRFLVSPRAATINDARQVFRELEFQVAWPPGGTIQKSTDRYLHGFIDCLYQTPDGRWVVVDYKTNRIGEDGVAGAARPYAMQLFVYAMAVETAIGVWPDEIALYFLRTGEEHRFSWDLSVREDLVKQVNLAITTVVEREDPVA